MLKAQSPRFSIALLAFAFSAGGAGLALSPLGLRPAIAQGSDPAAQVKALGVQGRFRKMETAVRNTYDLPAMMRVATAAYWAKMSTSDQSALVTAFGRFSAATYAHNFDDYSGQKFTISGVDTRLPDKLVRTQLVMSSAAPINLVYRMRLDDGRWRIIDVFYNGTISQLAQQASDFSATLSTGGAPALIKKLDDQTDRLLHGG
jgi:phospholipid transport system substrate-binding protein